MTIEMLDSIDIANIPKTATMVAGYVNGNWPTYDALVKAFPHAHHVSIDVNGSGVADVLDVERGDATPAQAPAWAKRMRALKRTAIIYCSAGIIPTVKAAFAAAKEPEPLFWAADWTNKPHLYPGSIATQWADGTPTYPGIALHCDSSLVSPSWPGLQPPAPKKTANPTAAQLAAHGYVLMANPSEALIACKNGWQLFVWNGIGFSNAAVNLPAGTHEYASKNYKTHNPAVKVGEE
jgi:hypothetical protein